MALFTVQKISKEYNTNTILENVSFLVNPGDAIGLVGLNGSGKTTLFQIIADVLHPDEGQVIHPVGWTVGYLTQLLMEEEIHLSLYDFCLTVFNHLIETEKELKNLEHLISNETDDDSLSELMNKYSSLRERYENGNGYGYHSAIKGTLIGLGFDPEEFQRSVSELSGGQKARLHLARMLLSEPDLLLLDEPTNHLDIKSIAWLEKFLRDYRGTFMVISHDRYFLDKVANRIFHIENSQLITYETGYTGFIKQRKTQFEILMRQHENQQKELERQKEIIRRFKNYGSSRYIKQAQAREKMIAKIQATPMPLENKKTKLNFTPALLSGEDVILAENLSMEYPGNSLFTDVNLHLRRGEHIGLIGDNGTGKTTLFKLIQGKSFPTTGEISIGSKVNIGYYDQEMKNLNMDNTVIEELWDHYPKLDYYQIRSLLARFLFIGDDIYKLVDELSGGEKGRLSLLILMLKGSNLLLLDEPTNHLDVDSKEVLEDALNEYSGSFVVISHDRYFLNKVCTQIWALENNTISSYLGDYDYYYQKKLELEKPEFEDTEDDITETKKRALKKQKRQAENSIRKQKADLRNLEKAISNAENELNTFDELLAIPETYDDYDKAQEVIKQREIVQSELDEMYSEWMILHEEIHE
ncbi:MAG: ABC-F family ATP-binding cassette domain-containing protein [Tissierellia bacterium]|nr:ABC-F family ATP-binding cassette domain-containing protein [Tissierellia bacterium]